MKLVCIFGDSKSLLTVTNNENGTDNEKSTEFDQIFTNWTDTEYLYTFFSENEQDLKRPYWGGISVEQAVLKTRKEAIDFLDYLWRLSKKPISERSYLFAELFQPLSKRKVIVHFLQKKKAYGLGHNTWLRLYALKADDLYIITGGAIKLTDNMEEREHTKKELKKLEECKQFIISEGIVDDDGIIELLEI